MFKPTVAGIMSTFTKKLGQLEDLASAHSVQIDACDKKMESVQAKCEAKVEAVRDKTSVQTQILLSQKSESMSEMIKAANAITAIKKLTGEVTA